jgi:ornithine cyclodeaminase/alanine dehydrogenase-like protein (mu-crystallin family)
VVRVRVLGRADIRLDLDELASALETALVAISAGEVSVPPRVAARAPAGLLGAMPGYVAGLGLGAKLVSVFPGSTPSHQGVIVLFDARTGSPVALLDAEDITATRTAMTAAVAARALVRSSPPVSAVSVLGAGVQGEAHLRCFGHLFPTAELRIASRTLGRAARLGEALAARVHDTFEGAVSGADIVCCCTDSPDPILEDGWIADGVHVSSVGSGRELPSALVDRAELFVESTVAVEPPPSGTVELEGHDPATLTEIGAVLAGRAPGRSGPSAVTVYKSMGHAAEDLAAASVALRRVRDGAPEVDL